MNINMISKEDKKKLDDLEFMNKPVSDMVNHPNHYSCRKYEPIDVIPDWCEGLDSVENFHTSNALKYLSRWKYKGGIQDLEKARFYIDHLIQFKKEEKLLNDAREVALS